MEKEQALETAKEIASLIFLGAGKLKHTTMQDAPLLAMLPFIKLSADAREDKELDLNILNPHIFEVLVFGSTANGNQDCVSDIDIVIIDNGFYSNFFECGCDKEDWYMELSDNLEILLSGFMGMKDEAEKLTDVPVDLHVFNVKMFKSEDLRKEILSKHKDPNFLRNCFSATLRFNRPNNTLEPVNLTYFEKRYNTKLTDLKQ